MKIHSLVKQNDLHNIFKIQTKKQIFKKSENNEGGVKVGGEVKKS